jgi:hypothetical protein
MTSPIAVCCHANTCVSCPGHPSMLYGAGKSERATVTNRKLFCRESLSRSGKYWSAPSLSRKISTLAKYLLNRYSVEAMKYSCVLDHASGLVASQSAARGPYPLSSTSRMLSSRCNRSFTATSIGPAHAITRRRTCSTRSSSRRCRSASSSLWTVARISGFLTNRNVSSARTKLITMETAPATRPVRTRSVRDTFWLAASANVGGMTGPPILSYSLAS